jgi:hypothetical protein
MPRSATLDEMLDALMGNVNRLIKDAQEVKDRIEYIREAYDLPLTAGSKD